MIPNFDASFPLSLATQIGAVPASAIIEGPNVILDVPAVASLVILAAVLVVSLVLRRRRSRAEQPATFEQPLRKVA